VHISHLKGSTDQEVQQVLEFIDKEARQQVDFSFESYPYQRGSTMVNYLLPYEVWTDGPLGVINRLDRPEVRAHFREALVAFGVPLSQIHIAWTAAPRCEGLHGMSLEEFVRLRNKPVEEALIDLLIDSNLATLLVAGSPQDQLVEPLIKHDLAIHGSDGIYFAGGHVHPRVYGSTGRWLGPLVRDRKVFSLEESVHKLSGKSAARFGLPNRGVIRQGAFADLVVFDAATVTDNATYEQPTKLCSGIEQVAVNGELVISDRQPVDLKRDGKLCGRYLKHDSKSK
jgi:N-acyl-D-amino-acid deacylase